MSLILCARHPTPTTSSRRRVSTSAPLTTSPTSSRPGSHATRERATSRWAPRRLRRDGGPLTQSRRGPLAPEAAVRVTNCPSARASGRSAACRYRRAAISRTVSRTVPDGPRTVSDRFRPTSAHKRSWPQTQEKPRAGGAFRKAGDEARTRDLRLGKPTLYQLSYTRNGAGN